MQNILVHWQDINYKTRWSWQKNQPRGLYFSFVFLAGNIFTLQISEFNFIYKQDRLSIKINIKCDCPVFQNIKKRKTRIIIIETWNMKAFLWQKLHDQDTGSLSPEASLMRPYFSAPINRDCCLSQGSFVCNRRLEQNCLKLAQKGEFIVRIQQTFTLRKTHVQEI